jgi:hypothetical protein
METSEALPAGAVVASDLSELVSGTGPFLTIVMNTEAEVENAAQRSGKRWRTLRSDLAEIRHVPESVLAVVDPLIPDAHLSGDGLLVVADASGVRHVEHGPAPGPRDEAWWEPLPRLARALSWRQATVPFALALADRTGADLFGFRHGPDAHPDLEREVEGDDFPIHKVKSGGWSQRRYQERVENTWEENAEEVAQAIARLAARVEARLVLLAGDVRAVALIQDSWPGEFEVPVHVVHGERPHGRTGHDRPGHGRTGRVIPDEAEAVIDRVVEADTRAFVDRFREERGQRDLAADGAGATIGSLAEAQVAVLLLHDDAERDETPAWIGPEPIQIAGSRDDLAELGIEPAVEVRRIDALIRAAIGTSAGIRFVPADAGLADGVGALLRWSDA